MPTGFELPGSLPLAHIAGRQQDSLFRGAQALQGSVVTFLAAAAARREHQVGHPLALWTQTLVLFHAVRGGRLLGDLRRLAVGSTEAIVNK